MNKAAKMDLQKLEALKDVLTNNDPITIVVNNKKEQLDRQREMLSSLGHYLHDDMEVPFGQIIILISPEEQLKSKEERALIAGDYLAGSCKIKEHNAQAPQFTVGKLKSGAEVGVNPLLVGRKIIDIDGAVSGVISCSHEERKEAEKFISTVCSFPL